MLTWTNVLRTGQEVSIYDLKKKPSSSNPGPLGREILVPLELVSRHYNPIINYKVGRSTMRTIVVVVLGSRDDGRHIYVYFPKNVQE